MADRIQLNENQMEDVVGGTLHCVVTPNGVTLYQYNDNHDIIGQWNVPEAHALEVYKALQSTYWTFEAGKRDAQCLEYFQVNGWI